MKKPWWGSKTRWINAIAIGTLIARGKFGYTASVELEAGILGLINLILRLVTKGPVGWKSE